jgi:DNA-binding protein YbaB
VTTPAGFEELHRLAGEAARFARIFSVEQDAEKAFTGQDETGLVTVSVNADGQVTDVELAADWDKTIDPRKLGATVIEAVNAATVNRVTEWADRVAEAGAEPAEPEPPRAPAPVTINPSTAVIEDLLYLLHRVGQETKPAERGRRRDPEPVRPALVKGRSDGGHVVVALNGKTVAEVRVETNTMWVGGANHLEVAGELRSAFEAAYRRAAEEAPARRTDSAVAELQALTADPQEFVARLFGLDR